MVKIKNLNDALREVDRRNRRKAMKNFAFFVALRAIPFALVVLFTRKTYQIATK